MLWVGGAKLGRFMAQAKMGNTSIPFLWVWRRSPQNRPLSCYWGGAQSHSSWLPLRLTKKGRIWEEARLHFVGNPAFYNLIGLNPFDLIGVNAFDVLLDAHPFHETVCSVRLVTSNFPPTIIFSARSFGSKSRFDSSLFFSSFLSIK